MVMAQCGCLAQWIRYVVPCVAVCGFETQLKLIKYLPLGSTFMDRIFSMSFPSNTT